MQGLINFFLQNSFKTIKCNIIFLLCKLNSLFFVQDLKILLGTRLISHPHSVDDMIWFLNSEWHDFFFFFLLCGTQDEFLNVSKAFNIISDETIRPLQVHFLGSFFKGEPYIFCTRPGGSMNSLKRWKG